MLRVAQSSIPNAGLGLFARADVEEGTVLGRMVGSIRFSSASCDAAEDWALAQSDDRLVLLRQGRSRMWNVLDVRGCVFEYANCSSSEETANMHVSESGIVSARCDVERGAELVWWYGHLHAAANPMPRGWGLVGVRVDVDRVGEAAVLSYDAIEQRHLVRLANGLPSGKRSVYMRFHGPNAVEFRVIEGLGAYSVRRCEVGESNVGDECGLCVEEPEPSNRFMLTTCCGKRICELCWNGVQVSRRKYAQSTSIARPSDPRLCPFCRSRGG